MKAVVIGRDRQIELADVPYPRIENADDVIVRVTAATICGTDVHAKHGLVPGVGPGTINGHEFVGIVEEVGPGVKRFKAGDRVTAPPAFWCGNCRACRRGDIQYCERGGYYGGGEIFGRNVQGAQAEYVRVVYADNCLVNVPDGIADEEAVLVGDVFQTGFHAASEGRIQVGDTVVIFGCGPIGIGALVSAWMFGPREVYSVDILDNRLDMAKRYGAKVIDARKGNVIDAIKEVTHGEGADVAIEAIGRSETFLQAVRSVRKGGRVSVVGLFPSPVELPIQDTCFSGITITMGLGYVGRMNQLMAIVEARKVNLRPLVTHTFPLESALAAYDLFENHPDECLKIVLKT